MDTELARVRGVVGYNLPKWLTGISYKETGDSVMFEIADAHTGETDIIFEGKKLSDLSDDINMVTTNFTNLDQDGQLTRGHAILRQLNYASSRDEDAVSLKLGQGSFSAFIKTLDLGKMMKYDYVPEFQSALYAPEPMKTFLARD